MNDADDEKEDGATLVDDTKPDSDQTTDTTTTTPPPPTLLTNMTETKNVSRRKTSKHASAANQDAKLKQLLANADEIQSIEHFQYWKDEFLETFRRYLDPIGTASAREADEELYDELEKLAQTCVNIKTLVKEGVIGQSSDSLTVKGRRAVNEAVSHMASAECFIKAYWPKTHEEEGICGYSKFELAAVLVRDGFSVFGLMVATRDYVESLSQGALKDVLKPNQRSIVQYYYRSIDSFVDTMADLGMYKLMVKCVEIYKVRPRNKKGKKKFDRSEKDALSDTSESDTVNGGRMFQRSKKKFRSIMDHGWTNGFTGEEIIAPSAVASTDDDDSDEEDIETQLDITGGGPEGDAKDPNDPVSSQNVEDDENQKRSKAKQEEEEEEYTEWIYYFDKENGIVGKVPRVKCLKEKVILTLDDQGKEQPEGTIIDEWDSKDDTIGKTEMIFQLKQILRGSASKKKEGLVEK